MSNPHVLQVSQLTQKVRFMLESELNTVWLTGEISNFIAASSGHWYLSLKDQKSQVRCAMFRGNNRRVRIQPQNGQQVLVKAKVSLYEPRGDFQLIIEQMEDAGEGLLRQQFEQLKNKLNAEGVFDIASKQSLPTDIQTVGIVTSPTGAAVQDILAVISRRNPLMNVIIYPCLVQGELAPAQICQAIARANMRNECDVLIVGRGGGSLEDLWCFNDEMVARTVAQSAIPTISAVGHEIDTTLADFAADMRAPTPSAAAELVSGELDAVLSQQQQLVTMARHLMLQKLQKHQAQLEHLSHRHQQCHPIQKLQLKQQQLDDLSRRLTVFPNQVTRLIERQPQLLARLKQQSPLKHIEQQKQIQVSLSARLQKAMMHKLEQHQLKFGQVVEQLHMISPLATIARGYSVTRNSTGKIVRSTNDVTPNQAITIEVSNGFIESTVAATTTNTK